MIEIIVMIGVITNAILQIYWFFWSKSIHDRKHFTDDVKDKDNENETRN